MNPKEIVPHQEYKIAARYAKALYQMAGAKEALYRVETELKMFLSVLERQKGLDKVLNHPVIGLPQKEALLSYIFKGNWISELVENFIKLLVKKKRLSILKYIITVYREIIFTLERKIRAYAVSPVELSSGKKEALRRHLANAVQKDVELDVALDSSLIGGLVVMLGDRLYDGSVKRRLRLLREELV